MGNFSQFNFGLTAVPPVPNTAQIALNIAPDALMMSGLNMPFVYVAF
jgi:hypothetical protein